MSLCPNFGIYDDSIYFCDIPCSMSDLSNLGLLFLISWAKV